MPVPPFWLWVLAALLLSGGLGLTVTPKRLSVGFCSALVAVVLLAVLIAGGLSFNNITLRF